jgi:hypothetical protein
MYGAHHPRTSDYIIYPFFSKELACSDITEAELHGQNQFTTKGLEIHLWGRKWLLSKVYIAVFDQK